MPTKYQQVFKHDVLVVALKKFSHPPKMLPILKKFVPMEIPRAILFVPIVEILTKLNAVVVVVVLGIVELLF